VRIGVDDQIFGLQRRGGISRYFTELITALRELPPDVMSVTTPFRWVANEHLVERFPGEFSRLPGPMRVAPVAVRALARLSHQPWADVDVVHHTYYDPAYLGLAPKAARVATVHDMIPELLGQDRHDRRLDKRRCVLASDAVICVSQATAEDLLTVYGSDIPPVSVVHLGVGEAFFVPGVPPSLPTEQFILYVGLRGGYKDFALVLDALASLPTSDGRLGLICVGGGPFTADEKAAMDRLGIASRVWQLSVAEPDLPSVYAAARAFVLPSRREGFGLPVLEAMASGCPVVVADQPVSREVAGAAAGFFQAGEVESLREEILRTLGLPEADRQQRVLAGRAHATGFSWSRTAELTHRVYRAAVESR
jgi:glycosyltransferase involved in cell wall biosynthesis